MNKCANEGCTTSIMDDYTYCGRCERKANKERKAKKRTLPRGHGRFTQDGRIAPNMGLKYCARLDFERKSKIANALIRWAETINQIQAVQIPDKAA